MPNSGPDAETVDYLLVGGGLQNGLLARALAAQRPEASVTLVERDTHLGGEHTWCFHAEDVGHDGAELLEPFVEHRWDGYDVLFPDRRRRLDSPYCGFSSARFREVLADTFAAPHRTLRLGEVASGVAPHTVTLTDGTTLKARVVVDARGPERLHGAEAGFQKFIGHELRLKRPHGLERPVLMDATVAQDDGFRFDYVLPLDDQRVLIEDTCFSDRPALDDEDSRARVDAAARRFGFDVEAVVRSERGVLPMPWSGRPTFPQAGLFVAGYAGGWVHPATGYSLPVVTRIALALAAAAPEDVDGDRFVATLREIAQQQRFGLFLNRLLFRWFEPNERHGVFERFHRLPESTIRRFYALRMNWSDRARILAGRPPRGMSLRARWHAKERHHAAHGA